MTDQILEAEISSLSHDGRGVARVDGKVFFIEDALPGERVRFRRGRRKRSYETGRSIEVLRPCADRVDPPCEYFGTCGGCALQHYSERAQIASKQAQLSENLSKIAKSRPETWLDALIGPMWHYRRKARLGIRLVPKKGGILIGFRERGKSYITSLQHCSVLDRKISDLLPCLHDLVGGLSCPDRIPQIEVAAGENAISLVFRHLVDLSLQDRADMSRFAQRYGVQVYLQPGGLETIHPLSPETPVTLRYSLPDHDVWIGFEPVDFVQVNAGLNSMLVELALTCLELDPTDSVLDLFCGLGNFTLPIARRAARVQGVEGELTLVQRARVNAGDNALENVQFAMADLYSETPGGAWLDQRYDKILLDPPRTGAMEVVKVLNQLDPHRVVYISCNPATLARDAEVMIHKHGFILTKAGVIDMFPHTNHVESIAVFDR